MSSSVCEKIDGAPSLRKMCRIAFLIFNAMLITPKDYLHLKINRTLLTGGYNVQEHNNNSTTLNDFQKQ